MLRENKRLIKPVEELILYPGRGKVAPSVSINKASAFLGTSPDLLTWRMETVDCKCDSHETGRSACTVKTSTEFKIFPMHGPLLWTQRLAAARHDELKAFIPLSSVYLKLQKKIVLLHRFLQGGSWPC